MSSSAKDAARAAAVCGGAFLAGSAAGLLLAALVVGLRARDVRLWRATRRRRRRLRAALREGTPPRLVHQQEVRRLRRLWFDLPVLYH